jgi:hypothetical protein
MEPPEGQQWGGVVDLMRQEARQQAEEVIAGTPTPPCH